MRQRNPFCFAYQIHKSSGKQAPWYTSQDPEDPHELSGVLLAEHALRLKTADAQEFSF